MDNRLHLVCNLLNSNDYPVDGHINTDCVYIRSTDGADSFTKADGSSVDLPARVEAGSHQGDVLLSFNYLSSDNAVAVDQNLNPHVLIKNKSGQSTILHHNPAGGWGDHGWANCTTVSGSERIYNDAMGVMMIQKYGNLYRFWNWDEATNHRADLGRIYSDVDRCYLQNTGDFQGLVSDNGELALYRSTISRPEPEIVVEGLGVPIVNRDDTPSIADQTDWGNVDLGSAHTNTYTIRNVGSVPLRIFTVRTTHPDFSVIEQPQGTLATGTQTTFKVEYTPSAYGYSSCVVSFGNSDLNDSRFMFSLAAACFDESLPPTAQPDFYTFTADSQLQIMAPGVLANDENINGFSMTAMKIADSQQGTLSFLADGSFSYTPNNGYIGPDAFSYKALAGAHVSSITTVSLYVVPEELEAHWKLDESIGAATALDASVNGYHASSSGVTSGEPGKIGKANRLDASSDITTPALNLNTNTITMTGWVNSDAVQNDWAALYFCRGGTTTAGFNIKSNRELRYHWNDEQYNWSSGLIVPGNQWAFVALIVEPSRAIMYMHDGTVLQSRTNAVSHAIEAFDAAGHIGADPASTSRRFLGLIDDVRVYSKSLSSEDINKLYIEATEEPRPDMDRDGDGLNDFLEDAFGMNPYLQDAPDWQTLHRIDSSGNVSNTVLNVTSGYTYELQFSNDLNDSNSWTTVNSFSGGTGPTNMIIDQSHAGSNGCLFIRVKVSK